MHFGRVSSVQGIDLSLPPDHEATGRLLAKYKPQAKPRVYAGCPVWADRGFNGTLYPRGTKPNQRIPAYAKQFNTLEVNAWGYKIPPISQVQQFAAGVDDAFRFCPKFPQYITHRRNFNEKRNETDEFISAMYELGDKLGLCLFQLPEYFKPDRLDELLQYLGSLPQEMKVAVEVRNELWFEDDKVLEALCQPLEAMGHSLVITDTPGRRDVLHMRLTSPQVMIRYNGRDLEASDYQRTDDWVQRTIQWMQQGLQEFYFMGHVPDKPKSALLLAYYLKELNVRTGWNLKEPVFYNGGLFG